MCNVDPNMYIAAMRITEILKLQSNARCEFKVCDDALCNENPYKQLLKGEHYMIITCENGYRYFVDVTADSILTACSEALAVASMKL